MRMRMRPRFRFRLWMMMVAIAVVSLPLAYLADWHRHGATALQRYHAERARFYDSLRMSQLNRFRDLERHMVEGHSCPECQNFDRSPSELIMEARRLMLEYERKAEWHRRRADMNSWSRSGRGGGIAIYAGRRGSRLP